MKENHFKAQIKVTKEERQAIKKQLDGLGTLRIVAFIGAIASFVLGNLYHHLSGYLLGALLLVIFIVLVKKYQKLESQRNYLVAKEKVLEKYVARLDESWKSFVETGEAFRGECSKAKDLDLLGRSSLYQYICVSHTPYGKRTLAKELMHGHREIDEIRRRQAAVKELIEDEAFALHLQTLSEQMLLKEEKLKEEHLESFIKEAEQQKTYVSKGMKILSLVLPFITVFCLILAILKINLLQNYAIAGIGSIIQLGIGLWNYGKNELLFRPIFAFNENISLYKAFLLALEEKNFKSEYLKVLQSQLKASGGAVKGLNALNGLTESVKMRFNGVLYLAVNSLLMWDMHCKDALGIWNKQYGKDIRKWLEVMGELESLLSLAVIGQVKESYIFPEMIESNIPKFCFEKLVHPLINEREAVGNSLSLDGETCIITGSNMSGKTTFLRSIGTNLALAYSGAPVLASSFSASYMEVFTSMRIEDRVDQGISTFYAELLRIKEMIEFSERHLPMLALVDELFKGTNSADRILGATETIKKLGKPWASVMVTTHDFELCQLAEKSEGQKRKTYNYHFEEYYEDNQIRFDYKIKKDRCKTTNAKYLLRMVGILD